MTLTAFEAAIRDSMPSRDEFLTMCAEGYWPPPSTIFDDEEKAQAIWDGLAMVKGILESTDIEDWPKLLPSAYEDER